MDVSQIAREVAFDAFKNKPKGYMANPERSYFNAGWKAAEQRGLTQGAAEVEKQKAIAHAWRLQAEENAALREAALRECSKWAREAGEAKGKLDASEMAGVMDGWIERAKKAEAERDALLGERLTYLNSHYDVAVAAYHAGAADTHRAWVAGEEQWEADFNEAALDYAATIGGHNV